MAVRDNKSGETLAKKFSPDFFFKNASVRNGFLIGEDIYGLPRKMSVWFFSSLLPILVCTPLFTLKREPGEASRSGFVLPQE
jgi:hypothetical protein